MSWSVTWHDGVSYRRRTFGTNSLNELLELLLGYGIAAYMVVKIERVAMSS